MESRIEYSTINATNADVLEARTLEHIQEVRTLVSQLADERGITRTELATRMGISKSHLSNIMNSQSNLTLETITRFEIALGVSFEFTVSGE